MPLIRNLSFEKVLFFDGVCTLRRNESDYSLVELRRILSPSPSFSDERERAQNPQVDESEVLFSFHTISDSRIYICGEYILELFDHENTTFKIHAPFFQKENTLPLSTEEVEERGKTLLVVSESHDSSASDDYSEAISNFKFEEYSDEEKTLFLRGDYYWQSSGAGADEEGILLRIPIEEWIFSSSSPSPLVRRREENIRDISFQYNKLVVREQKVKCDYFSRSGNFMINIREKILPHSQHSEKDVRMRNFKSGKEHSLLKIEGDEEILLFSSRRESLPSVGATQWSLFILTKIEGRLILNSILDINHPTLLKKELPFSGDSDVEMNCTSLSLILSSSGDEIICYS